MSADGNWSITLKTPMGDQKSDLSFKVEGDVLTGMQSAQGQTQPIANGKVDGDTVTWSSSITTPMPMTLEFTGTIAGDSLSGSCKAGAFGSFPFTGGRA
jgi:hypothetical protein